jgi:hypothetical protein
MKLNFGHGILLIIIIFMTGISILVYKCSRQSADLVNATYYEEELKFSEQITREKNSLLLEENLSITYQKDGHRIAFNFPGTMDPKSLAGAISFYKPDHASLDFSRPVHPDQLHRQMIETVGMAHGYWRVKVNWKNGSTPYYAETKIFLD